MKYILFIVMFTQLQSKEFEILVGSYLTSNTFTDSEGWDCASPVKITDCGPYHLLGGFNAFSQTSVSKTIALDKHEKLRVKALLMKEDTWDDEFIQFWADGVKIFEKSFFVTDGNIPNCGWEGVQDYAYQLDVTFAHTENSVTLIFKDTLDQPPIDESWGIRDIYIYSIFSCPAECDETSCQLINK